MDRPYEDALYEKNKVIQVTYVKVYVNYLSKITVFVMWQPKMTKSSQSIVLFWFCCVIVVAAFVSFGFPIHFTITSYIMILDYIIKFHLQDVLDILSEKDHLGYFSLKIE